MGHYFKKELVKYDLFSFGITFALSPKVDRKEIQYSIESDETQNSQIAVIMAKTDCFLVEIYF